MIQGSDEWRAARLGRVTASRIKDVMMKPTTQGWQDYKAELICERLTGHPAEHFQSAAMLHGIETEPRARANYILTTGLDVRECGFVQFGNMEAGASPDGLVNSDGMIEIKCPQPREHLRMLTGGEIQKGYMLQMQFQMACTGREWCDFVSFSPDMPDHLSMDIRRVPADAEKQAEIAAAVTQMLSDIDKDMAALAKREAA